MGLSVVGDDVGFIVDVGVIDGFCVGKVDGEEDGLTVGNAVGILLGTVVVGE